MTDTQKAAPLTNAERQARHRVKKRLSRDAARMAFNERQEAALLERYKAVLTVELAINPQSRAVDLFKRRVEELGGAQRGSCKSLNIDRLPTHAEN